MTQLISYSYHISYSHLNIKYSGAYDRSIEKTDVYFSSLSPFIIAISDFYHNLRKKLWKMLNADDSLDSLSIH